MKKLVHNSLLTFGTRLLMFGLQGLNGLLLARLLGPGGRGQYALIVLVPSVATVFFNFGVSTANAYFVSTGRVSAQKILGMALILAPVLGGAAVVALNLLAPLYWKLYPDVPHGLFRLGTAAVFFMLVFNYLITIFQGKNNFRWFNGMNILNPATFFLIFVGLSVLFHLKLTAAVWAFLSGFALSAGVGAAVLRREIRPDFHFRRSDWRRLFSFSSQAAVAEIVTFLNYRFDMFLVGYFLGAKAVGLYAVAVLIAETLWYLSSSVGNVLLPSFGPLVPEERLTLLQKVLRHIFWISVFMVLILFLIDRPFIGVLFGRSFLPSVSALRGLYLGVVALSLAKIISSYLLAEGKPNVTKNVALAGFATNVVLNLWWIPRIGILGAALASSAAYFVMALLDFLYVAREKSFTFRGAFLPTRADLRFYLNLAGWEKNKF